MKSYRHPSKMPPKKRQRWAERQPKQFVYRIQEQKKMKRPQQVGKPVYRPTQRAAAILLEHTSGDKMM